MVAARAVIGRLGDDGDRGAGETLGGVEASGGPCTVQDNNVCNAAAAELVDQQWEGSAAEAAGDADHRPGVDEGEAVTERSQTSKRVAGLQL